jgi:hypothetical protein
LNILHILYFEKIRSENKICKDKINVKGTVVQKVQQEKIFDIRVGFETILEGFHLG